MKWYIIVAALLVASCGNEDVTVEALQEAGYTDIEVTGWNMFECGKDDTWSTGFRAVPPGGKAPVTGTVCCGLIVKSCTIRF